MAIQSMVFNRTEATSPEISPFFYNFIIGACLLWGFAVNWFLVVNIDTETLLALNDYYASSAYLVVIFFGFFLFEGSERPVVSFFGYNLVVIPFSLFLNMIIGQYDKALVLEALQITGLATSVMMILGTIYSKFFQNIFGAITISLLCVVGVEIFMSLYWGISHSWIDWAVAIIFCGYIGYDWGRANQIPKTIDNAIDSAAALYMDIIYLFLRVLRVIDRD